MFFNVAHDAARPFVVQTPSMVAQALGTRFAVATSNHESVVTVLEGSVAVTRSASRMAAPQSERGWTHRLVASEQVRITQQGTDYVPETNVARVLEWATMIHFAEDPLIMAIEQFSRRSGVLVELQDPSSARTLRVMGSFPLDDPKEFATHVARIASTTVLVHRPGPVVETIPPAVTQ